MFVGLGEGRVRDLFEQAKQKAPCIIFVDELADLVNEAALLAVRRDKNEVTMQEFEEAVERVMAGLEKKNRLINRKEREIVAYHELGHALVALSLPGTDPVHKISIIPRGITALGYTMQVPTEDRYLMTKSELQNRIASLLGGGRSRRWCSETCPPGPSLPAWPCSRHTWFPVRACAWPLPGRAF